MEEEPLAKLVSCEALAASEFVCRCHREDALRWSLPLAFATEYT